MVRRGIRVRAYDSQARHQSISVTSFIGMVATGFPVGVMMWIGVSCFVFPSPAKPAPTNAIRDPSGDQHGQ